MIHGWRIALVLVVSSLSFSPVANAKLAQKRIPLTLSERLVSSPVQSKSHKARVMRSQSVSRSKMQKNLLDSAGLGVKQYVDQLKAYSQLRLTDKISVTVGTVKASPLSSIKGDILEVPQVLSSKMDRIEEGSTRGYGIKFRFDL